ncbi:MAG: phage major capsid protein [Firmicutes bacterium HGW-Firmicutes-2]|jgi:HK97 family phage major capsid protein|nr:MAG: phage major capsid protein [Firmicutes bacterium HGW-Firmicutes-2]
MNKEKYLKMRNALMAEAEGFLAEGKTDEANAKMKEIEQLDNEFEAAKLTNANLNALKEKTNVTNIENLSELTVNLTPVAKIDETQVNTDDDIYLNAWAKTLQGKKLDEKETEVFNTVNTEFQNAYTHDTGDIATLIPQAVIAGIWKRAEESYPLLADVKKYNVKGTLVINKHESIEEGDAAFYDEETVTADEKNVFGQLTLSGCELSKAITVTWKLRSMATEDFIPYIKNELGDRVGAAAGTAVARGKGKPGELDTFKAEPLGVETALLAETLTPQVVGYDPVAGITYGNITTAISKIHSSYIAGAAIYASNATIWAKLANILDETGRPIFIPDATSGGIGRMFGMTVKPDAGVTPGSVVIGNAIKGYVMNTNEPMSIATEEHVKARKVDYAAYTIIDGGPLDTKAFALLEENAG